MRKKQCVIGLVISVLSVFAVQNLSAALDASSYIREGLVLQLDAVENVSPGGAHQKNATVWKDLVGGDFGFPLSDGATFTDGSALSVQRNWSSVVKSHDTVTKVYEAFNAGSYTAEVAFNQTVPTETADSYGNYSCRFLLFGHPRYWIGIGWNNSGKTSKDCWAGGSPKGFGREPNLNWIVNVNANGTHGQHTLSMLQGEGFCSAIFDDHKKEGSVDPAADSYVMSYGLILNGYIAGANDGMGGLYHSVRFYDRPLTYAERAVNRAIDQVRYFGADAASITLPDGWRFVVADGDVDLQRRVKVTVAGEDRGSVSVNGCEAAASVELWLDYPEMTCDLSVTTAEGYRFVKWHNVEAADPFKPELSDVRVTGDVTASVYATGPRKLSAACYVQNGIIFQFDGIENQTKGGAHVAGATTWKDIAGDGHVYFPLGDTGKASFANGSALSITRDMKILASGGYSGGYGPFIDAFKAGTYTAEIAYDQVEPTTTPVTTHNTYFATLLMFGSDYYWMGLDSNEGNPEVPDLYVGASLNGAARDRHLNDLGAKKVPTTTGKHTLSVAQGNGTFRIRFDDSAEKTGDMVTDGASKMTVNHGLYLNGEYHGNSGITGFYHSIRLYGRCLSTEECRVNQAVDAVRFFGQDPVDQNLPDGYRFNTVEGIALEKRYTASASDGALGTVKAGDVSAGAEVDCWVDQNDPRVELTALPADGCRFVRWSGAVTGDDLTAATGLFTVTGDVTAVFKKRRGLSLSVR